MVGYKLRVNNVYGTINRTIDTDAFFLKAMFGGLVKAFGSSIKVESIYHEKSVEEVKEGTEEAHKGRGRPRKAA